MIRKIILVFKSHFDIGFTDLAQNVIRDYGNVTLRQVIETCRATEHMGALRYVWTMPAWPVRYITEHCEPELKPELDRLIRNGQIVWHALPFTSHTDCCAPEEYAEALQYARILSEQYRKPYPIAGKMTDVPGHGLMLPELLSRTGIRFLHLGCNEFAMPPDVPRLFWWQSRQGGRVLTMYSKGGYGTTLLPPKDWPYPVWMALMHTNDNCGPQTAELITEMVKKAKRAYPDAEIVCGTMDAFCRELERCNLDDVPVITGDLADTWIHGVGSYPKEVSVLRENRRTARRLHRIYAEQRLKGGKPIQEWNSLWETYYEQTALFEEHTWGADVKRHLGSDRVYEKEAFTGQRASDKYRFMETSWQEQRDRMKVADQMLGKAAALLPKTEQEEKPLFRLVYRKKGEKTVVSSPRYLLTFDPRSGRIERVYDRILKSVILQSSDDCGVFSYRYDRAGIEDVQTFLRTYGYRFTDWGILDYGRSSYPECEHLAFSPELDRIETLPDRICFYYHNEESAKAYGDAKRIQITVLFPNDGSIDVELDLMEKQASPFIEAGSLMIPFPHVKRYRFGRPMAAIDPETDIVRLANHTYYCVEDGATVTLNQACVTVMPWDTPLIAIGSSGLYQYAPVFLKNQKPEFWCNLFNNMWGTNFPQWIEGDFHYRFTIRSSEADRNPAIYEADGSYPVEGIPPSLELVDFTDGEKTQYLWLRDRSGREGEQILRFPGKMITETDLWRRPFEKAKADIYPLSVRPNGLHCIAVYQKGENI